MEYKYHTGIICLKHFSPVSGLAKLLSRALRGAPLASIALFGVLQTARDGAKPLDRAAAEC
jgi:hypothetical protein